MPLPRFLNLPPKKQRLILGHARAEFAEHGYDGASFNRIIATTGVSKGAMYYYFADKADLYSAVLGELYDLTLEELKDLPPIRTRDEFWQVVDTGMDRLQAAFLHDEEMGALARGVYASSNIAPAFSQLMARFSSAVERLIATGQEVEAVRRDLPVDLLAELTTSLLATLDRWLAKQTAVLPPEEIAPLIPRVMELLQNLLRPRS